VLDTVAVAHRAAVLLLVIATKCRVLVACPMAVEAKCRRQAIRQGLLYPDSRDLDIGTRSGSNSVSECIQVRDEGKGIVVRAEDLLLGAFILAFEVEAVAGHGSAISCGHGRPAQEHLHHLELALDRHEPPVADLVIIFVVQLD
jgi:hypothetical protein